MFDRRPVFEQSSPDGLAHDPANGLHMSAN
jgi:hypothetical protein